MPAKVRQSLGWVAALAALVASGLAQGRLNGRWAAAPEIDAAVARLDRLPPQVGTWTGEVGDPDAATLHRAGIAGGVLRRYRDAATGRSVSAYLVCGRPGPIAVHTPDVCYVGAGYELAAAPSEPIPGFRAARMVRPAGAAVADSLAVYWSWNAEERWEVATNPRLTFGGRPYLFKLYVVGNPVEGQDLETGYIAGFAAELIRVLDLRPAAAAGAVAARPPAASAPIGPR